MKHASMLFCRIIQQSKRLMKKKSFTSAHKRRKVTLDDDDSNLVAWDFSSQTVTYEHPMTKYTCTYIS